MTDSSDDSSDDGLLASPVFKKRDRRSERADRNKLDFLASCVAGSDARADVHRRIQEVDEEMRREEEEEENGGSESGKEGDDGDAEMEVGGESPGGDAATNEDNDNGAPKEEGKENSESNATAPETAAKDKTEEPSTVGRNLRRPPPPRRRTSSGKKTTGPASIRSPVHSNPPEPTSTIRTRPGANWKTACRDWSIITVI